MTGARITFKMDDKAFEDSVAKLGGVLKTGVIRAIGEALVEEVNKRFETGKDPLRQNWHPLLPAYAAIKKGPGILRASLMLQRSVTFSASGNQVTIGSNSIYAGVHQFGAKITAKNGKGLAFMLGGHAGTAGKGAMGPFKASSRGLVFAKSVTIPARPYLGFGPMDQRAVMETLATFIGRTFSG